MKPAGVAAIPERSGDTACLRAVLEAQLGRRVFPVHRLDKEVSGVILYALTAGAHRFLNAAFEQRSVHKTYLAVTHGQVETDGGLISRPIREFGSGRMGVDDARGKTLGNALRGPGPERPFLAGAGLSTHGPPPPDPRTPLQHRASHRRGHPLWRSRLAAGPSAPDVDCHRHCAPSALGKPTRPSRSAAA